MPKENGQAQATDRINEKHCRWRVSVLEQAISKTVDAEHDELQSKHATSQERKTFDRSCDVRETGFLRVSME